jgi:hypothetical protein
MSVHCEVEKRGEAEDIGHHELRLYQSDPTQRLVRAHVNTVFDNLSRLLVPTASRNDISRVVDFFDPVVSDE